MYKSSKSYSGATQECCGEDCFEDDLLWCDALMYSDINKFWLPGAKKQTFPPWPFSIRGKCFQNMLGFDQWNFGQLRQIFASITTALQIKSASSPCLCRAKLRVFNVLCLVGWSAIESPWSFVIFIRVRLVLFRQATPCTQKFNVC